MSCGKFYMIHRLGNPTFITPYGIVDIKFIIIRGSLLIIVISIFSTSSDYFEEVHVRIEWAYFMNYKCSFSDINKRRDFSQKRSNELANNFFTRKKRKTKHVYVYGMQRITRIWKMHEWIQPRKKAFLNIFFCSRVGGDQLCGTAFRFFTALSFLFSIHEITVKATQLTRPAEGWKETVLKDASLETQEASIY